MGSATEGLRQSGALVCVYPSWAAAGKKEGSGSGGYNCVPTQEREVPGGRGSKTVMQDSQIAPSEPKAHGHRRVERAAQMSGEGWGLEEQSEQ